MLPRFVLLVPALFAAALSTATGAEARRFKLFSGSKVVSTAPQAVGAARPAAMGAAAAPGSAVAPAGRSGFFVLVGGGSGAPAGTAPTEAPARARDDAPLTLATVTDAPAPSPSPRPQKPVRPAYGFETVSGGVPGFEVVKPRR